MLISPNHIGRIHRIFFSKKSRTLTKCFANRLSCCIVGYPQAWWNRHVGSLKKVLIAFFSEEQEKIDFPTLNLNLKKLPINLPQQRLPS